MGVYLSSSKTEHSLAKQIANYIWVDGADQISTSESFFTAAICILNRNIDSDKHDQIYELFPELSNLDSTKPYPENDNDITPNLFSEIAAILSARYSSTAERGAVNTPYQLAYDMAVLSIATKLHKSINKPVHEIYKKIKTNSLDDEEVRLIKQYDWLDPCVGTGVFPLAVYELLRKLEAVSSLKEFKFYGFDIDPLAICATRLRLAALCNDKNNDDIDSSIEYLKERFLTMNSLEENSLQGNIVGKQNHNQHDIVIGNPPYIRANLLDNTLKNQLKETYPSIYSGSSDLYTYFIASALSVLKSNGVVNFVSPAHFLKSKYGSKIRKYIDDNASVELFFDFNELPIFKGVGSHICVYAISNTRNSGTLSYLFNRLDRTDYFIEGLENSSVIPRTNIHPDGWNMRSYNVKEILDQIAKNTEPLISNAGNIYSGIKTGRQSVYVIDSEMAKEFIADPLSKDFIKPYIPPRVIHRWVSPDTSKYLIVIKKTDSVHDGSLLMSYLKEHKDKLESRDDISPSDNWYALRDCTYYDLFEEPKIVYPDISSKTRFSLDTSGSYITDGSFFLPSKSLYLLGILNSSLADFYFQLRLSGLGTPGNGGRIRFKKTFVANFPVPIVTHENKPLISKIESIVKKQILDSDSNNQDTLDDLVYNLYRVTSDVKTLIEEKK